MQNTDCRLGKKEKGERRSQKLEGRTGRGNSKGKVQISKCKVAEGGREKGERRSQKAEVRRQNADCRLQILE
jgi:hypothetical protein